MQRSMFKIAKMVCSFNTPSVSSFLHIDSLNKELRGCHNAWFKGLRTKSLSLHCTSTFSHTSMSKELPVCVWQTRLFKENKNVDTIF